MTVVVLTSLPAVVLGAWALLPARRAAPSPHRT